jgi:hypothetical protein
MTHMSSSSYDTTVSSSAYDIILCEGKLRTSVADITYDKHVSSSSYDTYVSSSSYNLILCEGKLRTVILRGNFELCARIFCHKLCASLMHQFPM